MKNIFLSSSFVYLELEALEVTGVNSRLLVTEPFDDDSFENLKDARIVYMTDEKNT